MNTEPTKAQSIWNSIITWSWTKRLLYWVIISAGTMSDLAFLCASLWVSINANIHKALLIVMPESMTVNLTALATLAYVALPECIVWLAVITVISHIRLIPFSKAEIVWSVLFGLPTVTFVVLSFVTLGGAVADVHFEMPVFFVVIRALSAFTYASVSFLYARLGAPQMADKLKQRDNEIKSLGEDIEKLKAELATAKRQQAAAEKIVIKSSESTLEGYSEECRTWLSSGVKSASVDDVMRFTGHSRRKINNAMEAGKLRSPGRNKDLILLSSLAEWLEQTPAPTASKDQDTGPILHLVDVSPREDKKQAQNQ